MSDDRINNSNDSRNRERVERSTLQRGGRLLLPVRPSKAETPQPVPFQQLMDEIQERQPDSLSLAQARQGEATLSRSEAPSQTNERAVVFREELERRSRDNDRKSDPDKSRSQVSESGRPKGKVAEEKVIARSPLSERQGKGEGESKGDSGKQGSHHWQGNRFKTVEYVQNLKFLQKGKIEELGQKAFLPDMKNLKTWESHQKAKTPTIFSKALLDQIVQYVRILSKVDGEKEMEVSLHEKIFKGLRLKVATVRSKVEATFMTQSLEVRSLFLAQRPALEKALSEKGIEVKKINVIMT